MKLFLSVILIILVTITKNPSSLNLNAFDHFQLINYPQIKDTCILQGNVFEVQESNTPNPLKANVRNGRIRVFDLAGNELNYRVIRYVFTDRSDNRNSSIRSYGDLVSYPVLEILKNAKLDEFFYFEEIIVVDRNKEIQNNAVRPIIIKRISN